MRNMLILLVLGLVVMATVACSENNSIVATPVTAEPPGPATLPTLTRVPTISKQPMNPTAAPISTLAPARSQTALSRGKSYSDAMLGLSFVYPANWEPLQRATDALPGVTLHSQGFGEGPEPIIFAITVDVQAVPDMSVGSVIDQQMGQVPSDLRAGITTRNLAVGGEPAIEVIGLPSQAGAIETFVLHKGQVFLIILQPYDESNESLAPYLPQARAAFDMVVGSWKFSK